MTDYSIYHQTKDSFDSYFIPVNWQEILDYINGKIDAMVDAIVAETGCCGPNDARIEEAIEKLWTDLCCGTMEDAPEAIYPWEC